jgi:hypothetical protein
MRSLGSILVLAFFPALATAQNSYDFQVDSAASAFTWSGGDLVGTANVSPSNFTLSGSLQAQMFGGGSPIGIASLIDGDISIVPATLQGSVPGGVFGGGSSFSILNARFRVLSTPSFVGAGGAFSTDVSVEMIGGSVSGFSQFGGGWSASLAGNTTTPAPASGTLQATATGYRLDLPIVATFNASGPGLTDFVSFTITGNLVAESSWPPSSVYCSGSANSVGAGATIGTGGTPSVGNADLTLSCQGLPANQPGIYFYGPNQVSVPFGNGVRCVGGGLVRLPAQFSGMNGIVNRVIDASTLPTPISAGETRNFQFWYRDPAAGGAFFNLSAAAAVEFTP